MGRLRTLTVILIFGAWGAATEGASPDDAAPSPAAAARKPAPVPPIKYLEAGPRLFNSGKFELAAKYLDAAQMYRDQLQADEQTTLDAYLKELSQGPGRPDDAPHRRAGSQRRPARPGDAGSGRPPSAPPPPTVSRPAMPLAAVRATLPSRPTPSSRPLAAPRGPRADPAWATTTPPRRRSPRPRPSTSSGACSTTRPPRSATTSNKERPKAVADAPRRPRRQPGDHKTAKAKLNEARTALADHQFEQAEAIALEVKGWNLSYGLFEDNPDKVAAAARALRKRDRIRNTPAQGAGQPGRLRRAGPGIAAADEGRQA